MDAPGSPSKRRKLSENSYQRNGDKEQPAEATASTPRRASYLSPTKASLSRSHPQLLPQTDNRAKTPPRRSLRDEILGQNNATALPAQPTITTPQETTATIQSRSDHDDLGKAIADEFMKAPEPPNADTLSRTTPPSQRTPRRKDAPQTIPTPSIVPRLVPSSSRSPRGSSETRQGEVDLPPTPVQLGKDPAPERPRGVISSSSPGGSGRRRIRVRGDKSTSSPLKPRMPPPNFTKEIEIQDVEVASGLAATPEEVEPQASGQEDARQSSLDGLSDDSRVKQEEFEKLQTALKGLQTQCTKLQAYSAQIESGQVEALEEEHLKDLIRLMDIEKDYGADTESYGLSQHPLLHQDPKAYLSLFIPGNLKLTHGTYTRKATKRKGEQLQHQVTIVAPEPWPNTVLDMTFDIYIDIAEGRLELVKFCPELDEFAKVRGLQQWIMRRLDHPLHKTDLAGIVQGVGQYFSASVKRAKIMHELCELQTNIMRNGDHKTTTLSSPDFDASVTSSSHAISLIPLLTTELLTFTSTSTDTTPPRIMINYTINLSWTGTPETNITIDFSGVPDGSAAAAKDLFGEVLHSHGLVQAFEAVRKTLQVGVMHSDAKGPVLPSLPELEPKRRSKVAGKV